jgi:transmembrane sensor
MTSEEGIERAYDPLDIEAVDWVVRLTVGRLSESDREAFDRWRAASADHERAFAAASDVCGHVRRVAIEIDADDAERLATDHDNVLPFIRPPNSDAPASPRPALSRRAFLGGGAVAASLAGGLMMVNPPLGLWPSLAELMADERTATGERRSFSPIAGVDVELNSRSSASRTSGGLDLIGGEAFISVAGIASPFRVTAGGGSVTAERATFNVQSYDGELCVTCVTGSVGVTHGARHDTLAAGREIRFAADGAMHEGSADTLVRLAWRRGLLILRGTPVSDAIPQINRYFPGRIVLTDSSKGGWPVTGVFHVDQIDLAVVQLERLLGVSARRLPGGVVLLG